MGTTGNEKDYKIKYAENPYIKKENNNNKEKKKEKEEEKKEEKDKDSEEKEEEKESEKNEEKEEGKQDDEKEDKKKGEEEEEIEEKEEDKKEEEEEREEEKVCLIKKIKVKIKTEIGIWEKNYKSNVSLKEIELDFKNENNIDKDKNYKFTFNNFDIDMDSRTLQTILIDEDQNEIILEHKIIEIENNTNIENINYIAKPMANPFEIYIFAIREKIIKKIRYLKEKVKYLELDKYGDDSSYCNGINHLFISGGTDPITNQILDMFVDIDIENNKLKKKLKLPIPKRNHSMIYFEEKVYIIGGSDEETMYYDIKKVEIFGWVNLNKKKYAPSLIIHDSFIYCFDFSHKFYNEYNIEKINLISKNPKWKLIKPKFDSDMTKLISSQKYFGLVKNNEENIIFLNGADDNQNINDNIFLKYNAEENIIEKNKDIKLINIHNSKDLKFNEKSFISLDDNTDIIFPYFIQRNPKILFYHKDKNELELVLYHSKPQLKEKYTNIEQRNGMIKNVSIVNQNNFINKNTNNNNKSKKNKKTNKKKGKENSNRDNEIENIPIINNISTEKNNSEKAINDDDDNNKENNEKKEKDESQKSSKDEIDSNKNVSENSKKDKASINDEKSSNKSSDKSKEKNKDKDNNSEDHSEIKEENEDKVKDIIKENNNKKIFTPNKENFHSSVDVQFNFAKLDNNKAVKNNLKKMNIVQPQEINVKYLKKVRRQFNNVEINDSDDFDNNY